MRWLRINETNLDSIPTAVNRLLKLEHLYVEGNRLLCIPPSIRNLSSLKALRASSNDLAQEHICGDLFGLPELHILDLSHNCMTRLPERAADAASLIALSVSHNQLECVERDVFEGCKEVEFLDLSHNKLHTIPPEFSRMTSIRTLLLSHNDLDRGDSLTCIYTHELLEHLDLAATNRCLANIPFEISRLRRLSVLNLSGNPLGAVPVALQGMPGLHDLNLSDCELTQLPPEFGDGMVTLQILNVSRNSLKTLPVMSPLL
jgi:leucine-rich repeat protein SHOC2